MNDQGPTSATTLRNWWSALAVLGCLLSGSVEAATSPIGIELRVEAVSALPFATTFSGNSFALIATDVVVRITIDASVEEGHILIKDPGVEIPADEFTFDPGTATLSRSTRSPGTAGGVQSAVSEPYLVEIQVVVPPGAAVTVRTQYSEVDIGAVESAAGVPTESARTSLSGSISSGRVGVAGPIAVDLLVADGELEVAGSAAALSGPVRAELRSSNAVLAAFAGANRLMAVDSTVAVSEADGTIELTQQGGSVSIVDSTANLTGKIHSGSLEIDGHRAAATTLTLTDSEITLGRSSLTQFTLTGQDSDASLASTSGRGNLSWSAGTFRLQDHNGVLAATLTNAAELQASGLQEMLNVDLDQSVLGVEQAADVSLKVRGSRVRVATCKALAVDARDSELHLSGFTSQKGWRIDRSQLEANFSQAGRRSQLKLEGESSATVRLPSPCFVRFAGQSNLLDSDYRINGCELLTADPTQRKRLRFGGLEGLDGSGGTVLQLDLSPESSASVGES